VRGVTEPPTHFFTPEPSHNKICPSADRQENDDDDNEEVYSAGQSDGESTQGLFTEEIDTNKWGETEQSLAGNLSSSIRPADSPKESAEQSSCTDSSILHELVFGLAKADPAQEEATNTTRGLRATLARSKRAWASSRLFAR
jgi:hypothetical protein